MIMLEPILLVRELPPVCSRQREHLPSLGTLKFANPDPQEPLILSYLAQGLECGIYNDPGLLYDVLQPGTKIVLGALRETLGDNLSLHPHLMLTDGKWVWPGALLYYVGVYHVRLPFRFVEDAARQHWAIDHLALAGEEFNWDAFDAVAQPTVSVR